MLHIKTFEAYVKKKIINQAKKFANDAHKDQFRKGINPEDEKIPYFTHPETVAKIVTKLLSKTKKSKQIAELIAAAYLHDTIEDTNTTLDDIEKKFGLFVRNLVSELTSNKEKIEISGKEDYLIDKMLNMSSWGLIIKLADRLHNLSDFNQIMNSNNEKKKKWAIDYANQTNNIISAIEWYRDLSKTQLQLVQKIKNKVNKYLNP